VRLTRWRAFGDARLSLAAALLAAAFVFLPAFAIAEPLRIELSGASLAFDKRTGRPVVAFRMTSRSAHAFAELTAANVGRKAAMLIDGRVVSAPIIREPILGGAGQIYGNFTADEARDMADRLASGKATLTIEIVADSGGK
jgi:preprotein translocase subunit SecD